MSSTLLKFYVALFLTAYLPISLSLYEYICTEKGLYTPYMNIYQGRSGAKIFQAGPGFYDMRDHYDIYICINGPAYLYYSHNTSYGEVFETPQFDVFVHKCGVYNKGEHNHSHLPKENQTLLYGVLLMGEPSDYRLPSIQLFTAPVYNEANNTFENGTSIMTFGNEDCIMERGGETITIKSPPVADQSKPVFQYCIRPFDPQGPNQDEEEALRATVPITAKSCNPRSFVPGVVASGGAGGSAIGGSAGGNSTGGAPGAGGNSTGGSTGAGGNSTAGATGAGGSTGRRKRQTAEPCKGDTTDHPDCICGTTANREACKVGEECLADPENTGRPMSCRLKCKGDSTDIPQCVCENPYRWCSTGEVCNGAGTGVGQCGPPGGAGPAAAAAGGSGSSGGSIIPAAEITMDPDQCKPLPILEDECTKGKPDPAYACNLYDVMSGIKDPGWEAGNIWKKEQMELIGELFLHAAPGIESRFVKLVTNLVGFYLIEGMKDSSATSSGGSASNSTGGATGNSTGSAGAAGGNSTAGAAAAGGNSTDPNAAAGGNSTGGATVRRKRQGPIPCVGDATDQSDCLCGTTNAPCATGETCDAGTQCKPGAAGGANSTGGAGAAGGGNSTGGAGAAGGAGSTGGVSNSSGPITSVPVGRKDVWNFINEALEACKKRKIRLEFIESTDGQMHVRTYANQGNHPIHHLIEEADNDFSFNWVIETHWKMFATVLGVCSPTSRVKQSVITSKLYTAYTDDFLKHLSKEWIKFKDNLILQYILGDYYVTKTESMLDDYLEAAFISSKSESYRPLRPLSVSNFSEDNFFRNNIDPPLPVDPVNPVPGPSHVSTGTDSSTDSQSPSENSLDGRPEPRDNGDNLPSEERPIIIIDPYPQSENWPIITDEPQTGPDSQNSQLPGQRPSLTPTEDSSISEPTAPDTPESNPPHTYISNAITGQEPSEPGTRPQNGEEPLEPRARFSKTWHTLIHKFPREEHEQPKNPSEAEPSLESRHKTPGSSNSYHTLVHWNRGEEPSEPGTPYISKPQNLEEPEGPPALTNPNGHTYINSKPGGEPSEPPKNERDPSNPDLLESRNSVEPSNPDLTQPDNGDEPEASNPKPYTYINTPDISNQQNGQEPTNADPSQRQNGQESKRLRPDWHTYIYKFPTSKPHLSKLQNSKEPTNPDHLESRNSNKSSNLDLLQPQNGQEPELPYPNGHTIIHTEPGSNPDLSKPENGQELANPDISESRNSIEPSNPDLSQSDKGDEPDASNPNPHTYIYTPTRPEPDMSEQQPQNGQGPTNLNHAQTQNGQESKIPRPNWHTYIHSKPNLSQAQNSKDPTDPDFSQSQNGQEPEIPYLNGSEYIHRAPGSKPDYSQSQNGQGPEIPYPNGHTYIHTAPGSNPDISEPQNVQEPKKRDISQSQNGQEPEILYSNGHTFIHTASGSSRDHSQSQNGQEPEIPYPNESDYIHTAPGSKPDISQPQNGQEPEVPYPNEHTFIPTAPGSKPDISEPQNTQEPSNPELSQTQNEQEPENSNPSGHTYIHSLPEIEPQQRPQPAKPSITEEASDPDYNARHTFIHTLPRPESSRPSKPGHELESRSKPKVEPFEDQSAMTHNTKPQPANSVIPKPKSPLLPPEYFLDISHLGDAPGEDDAESLDLD